MNMSDHPIDTHKFYHFPFSPLAESINIHPLYGERQGWFCENDQHAIQYIYIYDQNDDSYMAMCSCVIEMPFVVVLCCLVVVSSYGAVEHTYSIVSSPISQPLNML